MITRECRVLKQSELENITKALNKILLNWGNDWLPSDTNAFVKNIKEYVGHGSIRDPAQAEYLAAWSNDSWCALLSDGCDKNLIGYLLFGQKQDNSESNLSSGLIMEEIAENALVELTQLFVAGVNVSIDTVPLQLSRQVAVPAEANHPWSGAIAVTISIADVDVSLILSGSVIENIVPERSDFTFRISIEKDAVFNGIKNEKLHAEIKMESAEISIGSLINLSPGDVIVLDHKVDKPFNFVICDSNTYGTGYLGKKNGNYAIKLNSIVDAAIK